MKVNPRGQGKMRSVHKLQRNGGKVRGVTTVINGKRNGDVFMSVSIGGLTCIGAMTSCPFCQIPIFPVVKKDLTFIHLGNDSYVDGLVNFEKLRMIAKEIRHNVNMCSARYVSTSTLSPFLCSFMCLLLLLILTLHVLVQYYTGNCLTLCP